MLFQEFVYLKTERMPEEWEKSEIVPIYKQKGDPIEFGNCRGIKLLDHGMKMSGTGA